MRVAYICADAGIPVFGTKGCSIHVQEFLRALIRRGDEVRLYASRIGGDPLPGLEAVQVLQLSLDRAGPVAQREQASLAANYELRRVLESEDPFGLVYERFSLFSFAGMEYARSAGVPGVLEVNAPLIEEQAQYRQLFDRAGAERAARRVFKAASVIVAVSEEVADYLGRYPETQGRVEVVANGVDADEFMPKVQRDGSPADGFTVGFVGSLKPWHGLPDLVAAFATVREHALDARLLIVGDGPERARLEEIVAVGGLRDSVRLTGAVSHREVPALLATMDVAVAPYPKLENFYFSPLKVYEYMAAGLAVIASRTGQVAKLIDDGVSGLLYEPGEVGAMAAAIDRLRLAPEFRRSLGRAARAAILRGHTWEAVMQRILQITRSRSRSARADQSVAG